MKRLLAIDFVRFCIVGALGFVINLSILSLLYRIIGVPIFVAQLIAAEVALFNNFLLHNKWTYKERNVVKSLKRLLIEFHLSSWVAIVGSALIVSVCVRYLHMNYLMALIISSTIALVWNYIWSKYAIWKHHDHETVKNNE